MKSKAWSVALASVLAGIAIAIIQNKVVPCISVIQESFSIGSGTAGWLSSIFCVMGIAMAFPGAIIVEKIGLKRTGLLSLLFGLLGTALGLAAKSVTALMLSRVVEGVGAGLISIVVPSLISLWFAPEKRGLPMSLWSTWQIVAQSLCFFFGMSLTTAFGWEGVWVAGGVLTLVAILVFALFVRLPEKGQGYADAEPSDEKVSLTAGLKNRAVWMICIAMLFFTLGNFGFVTWVASAWSEQFALPLDTTNRYISLMYILALPISVGFGFVLNRVDHKKICVLSYALYSFVSAAAFLLPDAKWIIPYIILYPFFESAVCAAMWTLVPEAARDTRYVAVAMALFGFLQNVGMLLGPPLSGAIKDAFGIAAISLPVFIPSILGTITVALTKVSAPTNDH